MSLLLLLLHPFENCRRLRLLDQHFGVDLAPQDLISRKVSNLWLPPAGYLRPWRSPASQRDSGSSLSLDKDKFQARLDVQHFQPEEIVVKVADNVVIVEGKHEEKEDEHGYISRHFVRRYVLPKDHDANRVKSKLSSDGVLTITAPKLQTKKKRQRSVPVVQNGEPTAGIKAESKKRKKV